MSQSVLFVYRDKFYVRGKKLKKCNEEDKYEKKLEGAVSSILAHS